MDSPADDKKEAAPQKKERVYPFAFKLAKPLTTHKGDVTELMLRELTAADMIEMRTSPLVVTYSSEGIGERARRDTRIEERYDLMANLAAKMSGVDEILLSALSARDFRKLCGVIGEIWREAEGE